MKITQATRALAVAAAFAGVAGFAGSPIAAADDGELSAHTLGEQAALGDGSVVQGWTVTDLKVSTDAIPYYVRGTLWEATATDEALRGSSTPIVSNLNARAANGENYRVLFQVATPQGVNPSTLPEGEKTTGKVYFDVTGDAPDSVIYNAAGRDLLLWLRAPVVPGAGPAAAPGGTATTVAPGASAVTLPLTAVPAAVPLAPVPATTNEVNAPTAPADIHGAGIPTSTLTDLHAPDSRDIHGSVPPAEAQMPGAPALAPAAVAPIVPGPAIAAAPAPAVPPTAVPGPAAAAAPVAPLPAVAPNPAAGPNPAVGPTAVLVPAPAPAA